MLWLRLSVILTLSTVPMMLTMCSTMVKLPVRLKMLLLMYMRNHNAKWMLRGGGWLNVGAC